jgi:hypothetical protein
VYARQRGQFPVPQSREAVEVSRGDPEQVVGVAEEAFCVPDLGSSASAASKEATVPASPRLRVIWTRASNPIPTA